MERVEPGAVVFRESSRGQPRVPPVRHPLPGSPDRRVTGTVLLAELHYRYRVVDRLRHPDPVLMGLEGTRAALEVETLRPAAPAC